MAARDTGFLVVLLSIASICSAAIFNPISDSHRSAALELFTPADGSLKRSASKPSLNPHLMFLLCLFFLSYWFREFAFRHVNLTVGLIEGIELMLYWRIIGILDLVDNFLVFLFLAASRRFLFCGLRVIVMDGSVEFGWKMGHVDSRVVSSNFLNFAFFFQSGRNIRGVENIRSSWNW